MRKILGITMGDPAGVGPEITVKALQDPKVYESCKPLVVGDAAILERACGFVGAKCTIHTYQGLSFRAALSFWQGGDPDSNHKTNAAACGKRAGCVYGHCGHH